LEKAMKIERRKLNNSRSLKPRYKILISMKRNKKYESQGDNRSILGKLC
jgi:hypothetical protein